MGFLSPNIEWTEAAGFPLAGTYVGPEAVVQGVFMRLATEYDGFSVSIRKVLSDGDMVVALGSYAGTYRATGKSFTAEVAHVWTIEDGKAVKFQQIVDSAMVNAALS